MMIIKINNQFNRMILFIDISCQIIRNTHLINNEHYQDDDSLYIITYCKSISLLSIIFD